MMDPVYPWFGGKRKVAETVWRAFGHVSVYIEPFLGGGAVWLGRPAPHTGREILNDLDGFVVNFWRAMAKDPGAVAEAAFAPPSTLDMAARGKALLDAKTALRKALKSDADHFDAKLAGWWVYGQSAVIGQGWPFDSNRLPSLSHKRGTVSLAQHENYHSLFGEYGIRARKAIIACGDFAAVLSRAGYSETELKAVFLDPPYATKNAVVYAASGHDSSASLKAKRWAARHGEDPKFRIAVCGYAGEWTPPEGWSSYAWKATGGYGNQRDGQGKANAARETIWFSPHCLPFEDEAAADLFSLEGEA